MPTNKFYPSLRTFARPDDLPELPGAFEQAVESLLSKVFYKKLTVDRSSDNATKSFYAELLIYDALRFEVGGSKGIGILFNPAFEDTNISEFPVTLIYEIGIRKLLRDFNMRNFSWSHEAFIDLLKNAFHVNNLEIFVGSLNVFFGNENDPLQAFVDDYNNRYPNANINMPSNDYFEDDAADVMNQVESYSGNSILIVLLNDYIGKGEEDAIVDVNGIFEKQLSSMDLKESLFLLFKPHVKLSLANIGIAIEFPTSILRKWDEQNNEPLKENGEYVQGRLNFSLGELHYNSIYGFEARNETGFSFDKSEILESGFTISIDSAKLNLSQSFSPGDPSASRIRPDFIGVYVDKAVIGLPPYLPEDQNYSADQASIIGRDLSIGTGGFSGTLTLDDSGNQLGLKTGSQSGFSIALNQFSLTFQQNAIIGSSIFGTLTLPGFKDETGNPAEIGIEASFTSNGDFAITASQDSGLPLLKSDTSQDVMEIHLNSLEVGREDDNYFVALSGTIDLVADVPGLGEILPKGIEVQKLIIWQDGTLELEGGGLTLPSSLSLEAGPVDFSVTGIHMGSTKEEINGTHRNMRYIGFDGSIGVDPGGVDARGDGIKYYYTTDGDPFEHYLRIAGIGIDLIIPSDASKSNARLILNGYLSVRSPEGETESGNEYSGSVEFALPDVGIAGGAGMRLNPDTPSFLVDVGIEFDNPIPLGTTGLGFYGFRGLFGRHYRPSLEEAGVNNEGPSQWWEYYKAEEEGVNIDKFSNKRPGFSIGAGTIIATTKDGGFLFSSKIFLMISQPGVFLIGQSAVLRERVGMASDDPPFHAMIHIGTESVSAALGAFYELPSSGTYKGAILDLNAEMQMAFFYNDISAWYINFGEEAPDKRIRAKVFSLFDGYAFLMINSSRIHAGAGVEWKMSKSYGKASLGVEFSKEVGGLINFRPAQIGGHIAAAGAAYIQIYSWRIEISIYVMLSAELPDPYIIKGQFSLNISISLVFTSIDISLDVKLEWIKSESPNMDEIDVIKAPSPAYKPASAKHILTSRNFPLAYYKSSDGNIDEPGEGDWGQAFDDEITIPQDCFIDIEFNEAVLPDDIENIGGASLSSKNHIIKIPPEKAESDQVEHEFIVKAVNIRYWNEETSSWEPYKVYKDIDAMTENLEDVNESDLEGRPDGFWQFNNPGNYNKLRLLAQNIFTFYQPGAEGKMHLDALFASNMLFLCEQEEKVYYCVNWESYSPGSEIPDRMQWTETGLLYFTGPASVEAINNAHDFNNGVEVKSYAETLFTFYQDETSIIVLQCKTDAEGLHFYALDSSHNTILHVYKDASELDVPIQLHDPGGKIKALRIVNEIIPVFPPQNVINDQNLSIGKRSSFHSPAVFDGSIDEVILFHRVLNDTEIANALYNNNIGQLDSLIAWWKMWDEDDNEFTHVDAENKFNSVPIDLMEDTNGKFNSAAEFNGGTSAIEVLHDDKLSLEGINYTISAWVKTYDTGFVRVILDKRVQIDGDYHGYALYTYQGRPGFQFANGPHYNNSGESFIADGNWHMITVTVDRLAGTGKIYVDGNLDRNFSLPKLDLSTKKYALFNICQLTRETERYNELLPDEEDIIEDVENMAYAATKTFQPVWRPYTKFAVQIKTENKVRAGSSSEDYVRYHNFGFKTAGPIGHFHQTDNYDSLSEEEKGRYPLDNLKNYIDYEHSYPDARGKLTHAKPLYYKAPRLYLAFNRPYVNAMYSKWTVETGNIVLDNELKSRIYDPSNGEVDTSPTWEKNDYEYNWHKHDLTPLNKSLNNMENCVPIAGNLVRFTLNADYILPKLKPDKLYTAVFEAMSKNRNEPWKTFPVHEYNFKTSLYEDFQEHINSIYTGDNGNGKKAIFNLPVNLDSADLQKAEDIFKDDIDEDNSLRFEYADRFDRLMGGGFRMTALESAEITELNIVKSGNRILGFLLRSPEPFNVPSIPVDDLESSVEISNNEHNGGTSNNYEVLYAKDASQIFIANQALDIPPGDITLKIHYLQYSGNEYVSVEEVEITFNTNDFNNLMS